jgi:hypothetical protein
MIKSATVFFFKEFLMIHKRIKVIDIWLNEKQPKDLKYSDPIFSSCIISDKALILVRNDALL